MESKNKLWGFIKNFLIYVIFPYFTVFWLWYKKKWSIGARIAFSAWAIIALAIAFSSGGSAPTPAPSPTAASSVVSPSSPSGNSSNSDTTPAPSTPPAKPAVKTYKAGMYKIGADMPAGEYVLVADGMAYFQIAKDSTGQLGSILANDNFSNRSIVTVNDGQYLTIRNSTAYAFSDAPKVTPKNGFLGDGMYKVGVDIPAGEYKVNSDGMGYSEVSKDSSHQLGSIISNDNFQGEKYVTIKDGQYLKLQRAKIKLN